MPCDFSLKHYAEILRRAKKQRYRIMPLGEFAKSKPKGRVLLLRHDVDFSPRKALRLARVEKKEGVRATYFVRVHHDGYNPFGFKANAALREIEALGHEIGLHYECNDYAHVAHVSAEEAMRRAKASLEAALGHPVVACASHGDFTGISNKTFFAKRSPKKFGFKYEAWEKPFRKFFYASDALGKWGTGRCVCAELGSEERIYLCTHPVYWFREFYHTV